ncbi:MAG: UbiA-like polyprenyltransferase [Planctomycetota bacterium]
MTSAPIPDPRPSETPIRSLASQASALAADIKLAHTVFALPFALWAAVLAAASVGRLPAGVEVTLVVLCMVLARTFAMTVNRLADARFDAQNPRTANRAIPAGRMSRRFAAAAIAATAAGFVLATLGFWAFRDNAWPALLGPAVLALVASYSFAKRFTALCHVLLGVALAASPVAAAIAIEPGYLAKPTVWLVAGFVAAWVAGFDILYALADADVDRKLGLHAVPAKLGTAGALWCARALHAAAVVALGVAVTTSPLLGSITQAAAALVVVLLAVEHALAALALRRRRHDRDAPDAPLLHHAFFTLNGVVSVVLGVAGIIDAWAG